MKEEIVIPIYFRQERKKIIIDEESIYDELKNKLEEIKENPKKFLEIEDKIICASCGEELDNEDMCNTTCLKCGDELK